MFQQLDIKDGYWRGVVEETAKWNLCYVLPRLDSAEPVQLVVPKCLQMGWSESSAYFCTGSETARDVSEQLTQLPIGQLPKHELEDLIMEDHAKALTMIEVPTKLYPNPRSPTWLPPSNLVNPKNFAHHLEVFIDDSIQAAQTTDAATLHHLSLAPLRGIHSVFPPPKWTGHTGETLYMKKNAL